MCRARSARFSWPAYKWENMEVVHFPPTGPDCLPGCGYSGLPCYVCSSKDYEDPNKSVNTSHNIFSASYPIWTLFSDRHTRFQVDPFTAPVHFPRRGHNTRFTGPPPSYRSLFPTASFTNCCQKFRQKMGIPQSCSTQFLIALALLYGLLIAHLFWAALT